MESITLSSENLFWIIIVGAVCITVGWIAVFLLLRKQQGQLEVFLRDGNGVKLLTVVFVIFATTILAVMGALSEAVAAIFSGVVGYVLGSVRGTKAG